MKNMKYLFITYFMILISCKRCYQCSCTKNGQTTKETDCETVFIGGESRTTAAQKIEKNIEINKGYDNCEC